jgi:hypothetical protein
VEAVGPPPRLRGYLAAAWGGGPSISVEFISALPRGRVRNLKGVSLETLTW